LDGRPSGDDGLVGGLQLRRDRPDK